MFKLMDPQRRVKGTFGKIEDAKQAADDTHGPVELDPVGDEDEATTWLIKNANGEMVGMIESAPDPEEQPNKPKGKMPPKKGR